MSRRGRMAHTAGLPLLGLLLLVLPGCLPQNQSALEPQAKSSTEEASDLQVLRYKGRAYLDKGNAVMAINYLREAQRLAPNDGELMALLGRAYGLSGRLEAALAALKRAQELRPGDSDVTYGMGVVLYHTKRYREAEEKIRAAMEASSFKERDDAWYHLALIQGAQGEIQQMLTLLDEALKLNPVHLPTHLKLAAHYQGMGRYEQERRHLQEVLAETPQDVPVLERLAESHLSDHQDERAMPLLRQIMLLAPESENAARASKRLSMLGEVPHESH